jgi:hypothetical protein
MTMARRAKRLSNRPCFFGMNSRLATGAPKCSEFDGLMIMIMQGRHPSSPDDPQLRGYDITSAYPSKQFILPAMALPVEWELKKDGSPGKVTKRIEGKWIWREGAELTEDIIRTMSVYSMIEVEFSFPEKCFDKQPRNYATRRTIRCSTDVKMGRSCSRQRGSVDIIAAKSCGHLIG